MNPRFTIITPVYNRSDCIKKCIESVLSQSFTNWEHIIIDDGSTDNTYQEVTRKIEGDERFRYIRFENNSGTNAARNRGLDSASGDYILLLDSDDTLTCDALIRINDIIENYREYDYYLFSVSDRIEYYNKLLSYRCNKKEFKYMDWLNNEIEGDFCHVIKRELFENIRFYTKYRIYEDLTFIELYKQSSRQLFTNIIILERDRERSDSVTFEANLYKPNAIKFKKEVLKIRLEKYKKDYMKFNFLDTYFNLLCNLYLLCLLDGDYNYITTFTDDFINTKYRIPLLYKLIYYSRSGMIFNKIVKAYSYIKNKRE